MTNKEVIKLRAIIKTILKILLTFLTVGLRKDRESALNKNLTLQALISYVLIVGLRLL